MLDTDPVAVTRSPNGDYHLRWRHAHPGTRVTVSVADDHRSPQLVRELQQVNEGEVTISGLPRNHRHLFHLRDDAGHELLIAERTLALEGTPNFRDLGGYQAADGRCVKWGYLFRSGQLSALTDDDRALLQHVALDVVCDFRREEEQERDPSRFGEPGPQLLSLSITPGSNASFFSAAGVTEDVDQRAMFDFMVDINRDFVTQQAAAYSKMFHSLLAGDDVRMLVHCAAGKDRTGFAAAILLLALGVPRDVILADYMLSGEYFKPAVQVDYLRAKYEMDVDADVLLPVLQVHEDYILAALEVIDTDYGSVEAYLDQALKVSGDDLQKLRNTYLY